MTVTGCGVSCFFDPDGYSEQCCLFLAPVSSLYFILVLAGIVSAKSTWTIASSAFNWAMRSSKKVDCFLFMKTCSRKQGIDLQDSSMPPQQFPLYHFLHLFDNFWLLLFCFYCMGYSLPLTPFNKAIQRSIFLDICKPIWAVCTFTQLTFFRGAVTHQVVNKWSRIGRKTGRLFPRGEGGGSKNLVRGGSALRSDPLPFYIPLLAEKIRLLYIFHLQTAPLSYTFQTGSLLAIFMLRSINQISTFVRYVCSKHFDEKPL